MKEVTLIFEVERCSVKLALEKCRNFRLLNVEDWLKVTEKVLYSYLNVGIEAKLKEEEEKRDIEMKVRIYSEDKETGKKHLKIVDLERYTQKDKMIMQKCLLELLKNSK